jgi:hypothetical protein
LFNIYGEESFFLKKEEPLSMPHPKEKQIGVFFIFHLHKPNKNPHHKSFWSSKNLFSTRFLVGLGATPQIHSL